MVVVVLLLVRWILTANWAIGKRQVMVCNYIICLLME